MPEWNMSKGYRCGDCGYPYGSTRPENCSVCNSRNFIYVDNANLTMRDSIKDKGIGVD